MTSASISCFSASRIGSVRALLRAACVGIGIVVALPAAAHKASDAYLWLDARGTSATLRIDVALRDLDAALDIDADGDAQMTWAEVRAALPAVESYVMQRVDVAGCGVRPGARALEKRVDGAYAALTFALDCPMMSEPVVRYRVMREIDPTHRGLLRVQLPGQAPILRVLDPTLDLPDPAARQAAAPVEARLTSSAHASNEVAGGMTSPVANSHPSVIADGNSSADATAMPNPGASANAGNPASAGFVGEGVHHIVTGWDHVLFLICLLLPAVMIRTRDGWRPVERLGHAVWPVAGIVTAFTLAHSITLTLAALKIVSLSPSFIEPAIAATIVLAAIDNVRPIFFGHRGGVTFVFGLIHGFGFAGVLAELELPAAKFAWALFQFNLGLELGQLGIVVIATSLLFAVRGRSGYPAWAIRGGSFAAIAVGVLWLIERIGDVSLLPL
ncbi:MAG: HupE/UreJ family protein [Burkholderiaceae bacterium]